MTRILIFDGAPRANQERLRARGAPTNPELFGRALALHDPSIECLTVNVADGEDLPTGTALPGFDGAVITGSPLNVYDDVPAVCRQIEAARALFRSGLPVWGSCWGLQLAATVLGGVVRRNPRGRELGVARDIALTAAGRAHPAFSSRPAAYAALCSHIDEVETVPPDGVVLAGNPVSAVQALAVERPGVSFLGVQYHPEHVFGTTAAIIDGRRETLVAEGTARAPGDLDGTVADFRGLEAEPDRRDLAWRHGIDRQVTDPLLRTAELGWWLGTAVVARRAAHAAAA